MESMLERDAELEACARAVERAAAGEGAHLVLSGEPGSGRSSLLAELRRMADDDSGFVALTAKASRAERGFPFGIARQLLEGVILRAAADHREELLEGAAHVAEPLLTGAPDDVPDEGDFTVLHGLFRLVLNLAERQPVLLTIDDVDEADSQSLLFLGYVARRLHSVSVLLAVSAGEWTMVSPGESLESVLGGPETTTLRISPLGPAATAHLISRRLGCEPDPIFAAACHRATDGNARLLEELASDLHARGTEPVAANAELVAELAPTEVTRRLTSRLDALGEAESRLARALAILGDGATLRDAAPLARLDEQAAHEAADSLTVAGVLRGTSPGELRHPIFGAALRAAIPPAERATMQLEAAQLRADREGTRGEVAAHLLESVPRGHPWTTDTLRLAAGDARDRGDLERAVQLLRRALAEPPPESERPALLLELGAAAARTGKHDAIDLMQEAFAVAPDPRARARAALELAPALAYAGQSAAGADILERALADLGDGDDPLALRLLGLLLVLTVTTTTARRRAGHRLDEAHRLTESIEEHSARALLPPLAVAEATGGGSAEVAGALARRALGDGRLLAEQTADSPLPYLAVGALAWSDQDDASERILDAAIEEARSRGSRRGVAMALASRSYIRLLRGRVGGVEADATAFWEEYRALSDPGLSGFAVLAGASLICSLVEAGRLDEAERELKRLELVPQDPDGLLVQPLRDARARLALASGDPESALEQYGACSSRQQRWDAHESPVPVQWRAGAATACLAAGRPEDAERLAGDALDVARRFGAPRNVGVALRVRGLTAKGRAGLRQIEESVTVLERSTDRLEHARSLVELGAERRRSGNRSAARQPLEDGMRSASECGAVALAERAGAELQASGGKPAVAVSHAGPEELTPSERRVAMLAVEGGTNQEIARTLYVTVKTVEMHLSNAYRKLGISSRHELAGQLDV